MTYGHLQADCLYTGISSGPNAWCRVWEAFTFLYLTTYYLPPPLRPQWPLLPALAEYLQLRRWFCWSKVLLPACPWVIESSHSDNPVTAYFHIGAYCTYGWWRRWQDDSNGSVTRELEETTRTSSYRGWTPSGEIWQHTTSLNETVDLFRTVLCRRWCLRTDMTHNVFSGMLNPTQSIYGVT